MVREGVQPVCGCAPARAGRPAPPLAAQPSRQPSARARLLPQRQLDEQRVSEPSAKVDLPDQLVASNAVVSRPSHGLARLQVDGAVLKLVDPVPPTKLREPPLKPAIVPVASAGASSGPAVYEPLTGVTTTEPDEAVTGLDAPSATLDGKTVGRAIATTIAGSLMQGTRPSRLLGEEGRASFLANSLDGIWAIGEQAALGLIIEGKLPQHRVLGQQAVQVVAAAAQQEVDGLIADATQFGRDNGIRFLRNLEVAAGWSPGGRAGVEARSIDYLFQSVALDHTVFLQGALHTDLQDTTANLGLGYRYLLPDSDWMLGINAFYDRQFPIGHERMSLGLEASTSDFTLFANRYIGLSGWAEKNADLEERPLSGWDVGIAGLMPQMEDLRVSLSAFHWERETEKDKTGLKFMADYEVSPALQMGMTLAGDDDGNVQAGVRLTYQFGAAQFSGGEPIPSPWSDRRLAFVNRENVIHTESRDVPNDYAASFLASDVNTSNQTSLTLALSGAPLSSHYSFTITSSGGGQPVTSSGQVTESPQAIPGVDVSGLADGTLTLTIQVISKKGAVGPKVMAQIVKSTAAVSVSTSLATSTPANVSPLPFRIVFSRAVSGFDLSDIAVSNGTASNLQTADSITWTVDVTPSGQGAVELQIPAAVATGGDNPNGSSNPTTVIFDSEAPSGYSTSFLVAPIDDAGFEIGNAEVGASYSFTIGSSGGGTPVTGSGTVGSIQQQVTGLDLSGLGDGTLTLSVTLSDALGNTGAPVTATMVKDNGAPVIVSITPPAPGLFNDL